MNLFDLDLKAALTKLYETTIPLYRDGSVAEHAPGSGIELMATGPFSDSRLLGYAMERGISSELLSKACLQVSFRNGQNPRIYTAIGFANRSGGYELRNRYFKGAASPKDITLLNAGYSTLSIFEGFFDYLSFRESALFFPCDVLVLNSLSLWEKAAPVIQLYGDKRLYLDNDPAADRLIASLEGIVWQDEREHFKGYKDLNDYLLATKK
jgi:hypothetical protein